MKFFFLLIIIVTINSFPQTDWKKWDKREVSYTIENNYRNRDYSFEGDNVFELTSKTFANAYWFFFSDLDGDNCPFSPSCSSFLLESMKQTNPAQGVLMFFDRFTRDTNIYMRDEHYAKIKGGRYLDPPINYTLNNRKINYIPPGSLIEND